MDPIEPPPTRWRLPDARAGRRRRDRRRRRRPRAGHAARRLPQRAVPDAARAAQHRLVLARPARRHPARRAARQPLAAPQHAPLRGPPRHPLRRGDGALRRPAPPRRVDHAGVRQGLPAPAPLGWANSVECYDDDGELVGGLYGVRIGGFFAGESMFHTATDASKVALVALVEWLARDRRRAARRAVDDRHLRSLGAVELPRDGVPRPARRRGQRWVAQTACASTLPS